MFVAATLLEILDWPFLPFNTNLFAEVDEGLLCGSRFVSWKKVKLFHFDPIDQNHKYYGFSKEVNDGYELKIIVKYLSISCIVTSQEMKEKFTKILNERLD